MGNDTASDPHEVYNIHQNKCQIIPDDYMAKVYEKLRGSEKQKTFSRLIKLGGDLCFQIFNLVKAKELLSLKYFLSFQRVEVNQNLD